MSDSVCKNCGVGINFIALRDGADWCHVLGARRCWNGTDAVAEPVISGGSDVE